MFEEAVQLAAGEAAPGTHHAPPQLRLLHGVVTVEEVNEQVTAAATAAAASGGSGSSSAGLGEDRGTRKRRKQRKKWEKRKRRGRLVVVCDFGRSKQLG